MDKKAYEKMEKGKEKGKGVDASEGEMSKKTPGKPTTSTTAGKTPGSKSTSKLGKKRASPNSTNDANMPFKIRR